MGDLFAPVQTLEQELPRLSSGRQWSRVRAGRASVVAQKSVSDRGEALGIVVVGHVARRPGKTSKRLPGIASWAARPCSTGMIESCSPHTISVGRTAARCRRSLALTRWPRGVDHGADGVQERLARRRRAVERREALGEHREVAVGGEAARPQRRRPSRLTPRRPARGEQRQAPSPRRAARRRAGAGGPRGPRPPLETSPSRSQRSGNW